MSDAFVAITRGEIIESRHRVHVAVVDAERGLIASAGDPFLVSYVRSAIKMFQALPLVEDGGVERFALSPEELALCTASHNAEAKHVAAARSILQKAGVDESALACGPHPPMDAEAAAALQASGQAPTRGHNNCSGKHAGMLALAVLHQWPLDGYHRIEHPLQQRVVRTLSQWSATPSDMPTGIDGCGLPTFALPLAAVATAAARFARASTDESSAAGQIILAMLAHPDYVAGRGRLCTDLMRVAQGRVFAKVGAEGYYLAGSPARGIGIALKVEDGAKRAAEPALLAVLHALDLLSDAELELLESCAQPQLLNTRGEHVGSVVPHVELRSQ